MLIPLLFHFNQHLSEKAVFASRVCYRGLLRTLRAHPAIKANIHISGTLITALKWLDPEPLQIIQDGISDGQFEIVGSTFAQNVPYATDDWDNARQIELHKEVIEDTFGITPTAFWNPERCWRQSLVPVIANSGYRITTVEDHILDLSGACDPHVYYTRAGDDKMNVVRDDEKLKHLFNFAAWFGNTRPLHAYLDKHLSSGKGGNSSSEEILAYAEDAEAMGLWGYFQGIIPSQTWERLDSLLKELATRKDVKTVLFSQLPPPVQEISPIVDGSASWMDASLAHEGLPYHESGYKDWFDFNTNSSKLAKFREFFTDLRLRLQNAEKSTKHESATRIYQLGLHSYLTHQYEFGCIGIGGDQFRGWLGAKAARVLASSVFIASLSKRSGDPMQFTIVDDLSQDGIPEWIHVNETRLIIASPVGGRLLYWLNLRNGQMMIGNPSAVVDGDFEGHAIPPHPTRRPKYWLPDDESYTPYEQTEPSPTRMAKFLPPWVWEETGPVSLAVREMKLEGETTTLAAQQGALCDEIWLDGKPVFTRRDSMEAEGSQRGIRFLKQLRPTIAFRKKYTIDKNTLTVDYTFTNTGKRTRKMEVITTSELSLDYAAILQHGEAALKFIEEKSLNNFGDLQGLAGIENPLTGDTLTIAATRLPTEVTCSKAMLGLNIGLRLDFSVPPSERVKYFVHLMKG